MTRRVPRRHRPSVAELLVARAEDDASRPRGRATSGGRWAEAVAASAARAAAPGVARATARPAPRRRAARQRPRVPVLAGGGGPGRRGGRRDQPDPAGRGPGRRHPAHRLPGAGDRRRGGRACSRVSTPACPPTGSSGSTARTYAGRLAAHAGRRPPTWWPRPARGPSDLYLLLFTSGTTGAPKAVRCTQGRLAVDRRAVGRGLRLRPRRRGLLHHAAVPRQRADGPVGAVRWWSGPPWPWPAGSAPRASSPTCGATAPPPSPTWARPWPTCWPRRRRADDASMHPAAGLRHRGVGGRPRRLRAAVRLRAHRGVRLERGRGGHQPDPGHPGGLARAARSSDVVGRRPRPRGASARRPSSTPPGALVNGTEAIGEIVNRTGIGGFEGYYADPEATATGSGTAGTGPGISPTATRTGFFYFAGRRRRLDAGGLGEPDRRPDRAGPRALPRRRHGRRLPGARPPLRRPGDGRPRAAARAARSTPTASPPSSSAQPDLGTKWAPPSSGSPRRCPRRPAAR